MARNFTSTDSATPGSFTRTGQWSYYFWYRAPNTTGTKTVAAFKGSNNDRFTLETTTLKIRLQTPGTNSRWSCASGVHGLTLTDWNHYAVTVEGTSANDPILYVNGQPVALTVEVASNGAINTTAGTMLIGNENGGTQPAGDIEWFAAHHVVLTQAEVLEAMYRGFTPRGMAWGTGFLGDSPEPDLSGNVRNFTLTGTTVVPGAPVVPLWVPTEDGWSQQAADAPSPGGGPIVARRRRARMGAGR